tara:strand:- start:527 stop:997 length:471 start_codon:yes stop_codon:yes gene_type:complete
MTSTQAQKETKMNEITNTRTAIKDADHLAEAGRTSYANVAVTTFTDRRGNDAKLVSGQIGTQIGSIILNNEIRSGELDRDNTTWTGINFVESKKNKDLEIMTHSSGDNGERISLSLNEGKFYGIGGSGSQMGMILNIETAKQMVAALSAQIAANEA